MTPEFKHDPPSASPFERPLRRILLNDSWAAFVQGLFSPATDENFWAFDEVEARDNAIQVEQLISLGIALVPVQLHCKVRRTTNQNLLDNTLTTISFDTEDIDAGNLFDPAEDDRINLPAPGAWLIGAEVRWESNGVGHRSIQLDPDVQALFLHDERTASVGAFDHATVGIVVVTEPDFVQLKLRQNSGTDLDAQAVGERATVLWAHYLGTVP